MLDPFVAYDTNLAEGQFGDTVFEQPCIPCAHFLCDYSKNSNDVIDACSSPFVLSRFQSQLNENLKNMTRTMTEKLVTLVNQF